MAGRPRIFRTPEEIKLLQKQRRKKYQTYFKIYQKLYHLKKKLAVKKLKKSGIENDK